MSKKIDRERAILNMGMEAHRRVLKNEVMKFRLESQNLERLLSYAYKQKKPPGTLVREWVIEKLDQAEREHTVSPEIIAIGIIADTLANRGLLKNDQINRIQKLLQSD